MFFDKSACPKCNCKETVKTASRIHSNKRVVTTDTVVTCRNCGATKEAWFGGTLTIVNWKSLK